MRRLKTLINLQKFRGSLIPVDRRPALSNGTDVISTDMISTDVISTDMIS
jgi:hypothetical protein